MTASTWNDKRWFWEEHNANVWAKERLTELVNQIHLDGWELSDFNFSSIQAARSIRKNREIRSFEIVFDCKFKFNEMEGKISFPDVSEDAADSPDEWEAILSFTGKSNDKPASEKKPVRAEAEKVAIPAFRNAFAQWVKEFKELPSEAPAK
ncbi:hypothetical protein M9Y10_001260 [Tritrichomonas musculus]|uniref:Activator of Hsp90 ATPase AHSA1-like N-terminal domain-containing protein n=1 Tax=Tritrichomonas musculus TaxID=1915356 RepID=A0ABR2L6I8_9EUKA